MLKKNILQYFKWAIRKKKVNLTCLLMSYYCIIQLSAFFMVVNYVKCDSEIKKKQNNNKKHVFDKKIIFTFTL